MPKTITLIFPSIFLIDFLSSDEDTTIVICVFTEKRTRLQTEVYAYWLKYAEKAI